MVDAVDAQLVGDPNLLKTGLEKSVIRGSPQNLEFDTE